MTIRLLTPAAGLLSLAVPALRAADAEEASVKFVLKLGGKIVRDDKAVGKPVVEVDLTGTPT